MTCNNNQKVAIFCPSLSGGGAEKAMVNLASGLVSLGAKVDFLLVQVQGRFIGDIPEKAQIVDLGGKRTISVLPALIRYLRKEEPSVLLTALDNASVVGIVSKILCRARTPIVVSVHAPLSRSVGRATTIFGRIFDRLIRWTYPIADAVVAVSDGVRNDLLDNYHLASSKVHTIYNPIIGESIRQKSAETVTHSWLRDGAPPFVLAVGRLSDEKDYKTLISAFYLIRKNIKVRMLILGEGPEKDCLQLMINKLHLENDVFLEGFHTNPYVFMKHCSCYVLSSKFEGFGNVLVEALEMGCSIVSTDCPGGPNEILKGGCFGQMVPIGDVDAMAKAILNAISKGRNKQTESLTSHLKKFEIGRVASQYKKLFDSIVA